MAGQSHPRVSIGMPIYDAAAHLESAIDSLLNQTYTDFEIILSDNASTDATESICRQYAERDPRVRYVRHQVNRGSTWNFNEAFHLSRGEYFKWAAYDDVCHSTYVERCVEVLDRQRDVIWCHSRSQHIGVDGRLLQGAETPEVSYANFDSDGSSDLPTDLPTRSSRIPSERFRAVLLGKGGCLDSYGLIRSSVLGQTGLYLPYFGSEKVLMAELGLWGRYYEIPETLFWARVHPKAVGSQRTSRLQRATINPLAGRDWRFARWHLLRGYLAAIGRSPIGINERMRCIGIIARYVFQVHKWGAVVAKALSGRGLAGEYPSIPVRNYSATASPSVPRH